MEQERELLHHIRSGYLMIQSETIQVDSRTGRIIPTHIPQPTTITSNTNLKSEYDSFFNKGKLIVRTPKHDTCIISQEPIQTGCCYHSCLECHQSVSTDGLREWWNTCVKSNKAVTCPACRHEWTDSTIYFYG